MQKSSIIVSAIWLALILILPACTLSVHAQEDTSNLDDTGRAYYDLGVFAYEDGDYENAEFNLTKAVELDPDVPYFHHYLGKCYLKQDKLDQAKASLDKAGQLGPQISGLEYDMGLLHYKKEEYGQAINYFRKAAVEEKKNADARFNAGMCHYKLEEYGMASKWFITAGQAFPELKGTSSYYAGMCELKAGNEKAAVKHFDYAGKKARDDSIRAYSKRWSKAIKKKRRVSSPFRLYAKAGVTYDDNVLLEPLDQDLYTNEDDILFKGFFSGTFNVIEKENAAFGLGYNHYQALHKDLDEYDLSGSIGNIYARYHISPFTIGINYMPAYYVLDDNSFLTRHEIKPTLTFKAGDNFMARVSYRFMRNKYFTNQGACGNSHEPGMNVYYYFGDSNNYLKAGASYEINEADSADEDYSRINGSIGVSFGLFWDLNLNLMGKYSLKEYDNADSSFFFKRKDNKYYGGMILTKPFFEECLSMVAEYNFTRNDSNNRDYDYQRQTASLSVAVRY